VCVIDDDMTSIMDKMLHSDIIVIGSPRYFDNVTGLLKDFVDRNHPFYRAESLKGKRLILFMVGGGSIEASEKYLDYTMHGYVKYLKLDLAASYCFKAYDNDDLEQDARALSKIDRIVEKIRSL